MTVIAIKGGIMAADSAVWQGNIIVAHTRKIQRLKDVRLFGGTGESAVVRACALWLDGLADKPEAQKDGEFHGLFLGPDGIERIDYRFTVFSSSNQEWAVTGAHEEFMAGALLMGASAEHAVKLAIERGDSAGGEVQVERL